MQHIFLSPHCEIDCRTTICFVPTTLQDELYTGDENYCIFITENLKLTAHVRWQGNSEILQLKFICAHNSCNNDHRMELLTFNRDRVKILSWDD